MVRVAIGGKGTPLRAQGVRLHTEIGESGEAIMNELIGPSAEWIGSKRFSSWQGSPPVDVVDHETNIGYQVKVITQPKKSDIAFSGAHKEIESRSPGGKIVYGKQGPIDQVEIKRLIVDNKIIGRYY